MLSFSELLEQNLEPLYVSVEPDENTKRMLSHVALLHNIPNPYHPSKMHCTLIYSKKACKQPFIRNNALYTAEFEKWHVFKTQDGKNCLVAKLRSADLLQRHRDLMTEMGASYDFDEYLPHITISYDIGDLDIAQLPSNPIGHMFLGNESCVVLNQGYE